MVADGAAAPPRPGQISKIALLLCTAALTAIYLYMAAIYALPFPQNDDYGDLVGWSAAYKEAHSLAEYLPLVISPSAEHQKLLNKAVLALWLTTGSYSQTGLILLGDLAWCLVVYGVMAIGYRRLRSAWAVLPAAFVGLTPLTYDSISFAAGWINLAYLVFVVGPIFFIPIRRRWALITALVLAAIGTLSTTAAFAVFVSLALVLVLQARWRDLVPVGAVLAVLALLYLGITPHHPPFKAILGHGAEYLFRYLLLFLGGMVGNAWIGAGYALGALLLIFWLAAAVWGVIRPQFRGSVDPAFPALAVFCFGAAILGTFGRSDLGLGQAVSSRYALISMMLTVATWYVIADRLKSRGRSWASIAVTAASLLFAVVCYRLYLPAMTSQWNDTVWNARAYFHDGDRTQIASLAPNVLEKAFSTGALDRAVMQATMDHAAPVLAPPIEAHNLPAGTAADETESALNPVGIAPELLKIEGWLAVPKRNLLAAERWVVLDNRQRQFLVPATPLYLTLQGDPHRDWSGFAAFVNPDRLPAGTYFIGLRLRLGGDDRIYRFPGRTLVAGNGRDLLGSWRSDNGTVALSAGDDDHPVLIDEQGKSTPAKLSAQIVSLPTLGKTGWVNAARDRIDWSDGSVWSRPGAAWEADPTYRRVAPILGRWRFGNDETSIDFAGAADVDVILTNENGSRVRADLRGKTISVPAWHITGYLAADDRSIVWSNGSVWHR